MWTSSAVAMTPADLYRGTECNHDIMKQRKNLSSLKRSLSPRRLRSRILFLGKEHPRARRYIATHSLVKVTLFLCLMTLFTSPRLAINSLPGTFSQPQIWDKTYASLGTAIRIYFNVLHKQFVSLFSGLCIVPRLFEEWLKAAFAHASGPLIT